MHGARVALLAAGGVLSLLAGLGGAAGVAALWLAQPLLALAVRQWRSGGARLDIGVLKREWPGLAAAWGLAMLAAVVLTAWPLSVLRQTGSLGAAVALSMAAGLCLIGLWRLWPLWQGIESQGGALRTHLDGLADQDASDARGMLVAACVAAVLAAAVLLAWPGLLPAGARWTLAALGAVLWPCVHLVIQRAAPARMLAMPVVEMPDPVASASAPAPATDLPDDIDAALYVAARGGRVDRALTLLEAGADVHALPPEASPDRRSLPVLAAVLPDLRLLRALIARGVDLNASHAGLTPLLAATRDSWHGRPESVMTLLANGADPRVTDADGNTPLHHAARSSDPGVAALLHDAAAVLDALNHDKLSPLGVACAAGNWRLARFLLERGAQAEVHGATPALLAAAGGDEDDVAGVQLLLKHKARASSRSADGRSALHEAARAGHVEIVAALLAAGADVHARDARARTPLLDAAHGARLAALEALLAAGARVDVQDDQGRSALVLACLAERPPPALLARLLALGVSPAVADAAGRRPVDHAATAGRWSLVALLDPDYPLPVSVLPDAGQPSALPDRAPLALLQQSLREGRYDGLEGLLPLVDAQALGALLQDPQAPASAAHIEWLLAHGADADVRPEQGDTALLALLARGPQAQEAIQVMLRHDVSPAGAGGLARLLAACARGDQAGRGLEQLALDLLARGADPFAPAPEGDPPLSLAVRLGWQRLVQALAQTGVDLDARDARGMTALHLAAALGRADALRTLVAHGACPQVRAADGQTPLGVALAAGRRDLADWLDWRGWPLPRRPLQPGDLPAAAMSGDVDAVRRLLDLGFAVETTDAQGCTALLRAAGGGHRAAVDLLIERGADPKATAQTGATPLSAAVSMRQMDIIDRLLEAGAPLEQRLPGDVTVLMLAAALGLPDVCARLLTAGADIHATDAQGLAALHCAALYGFGCRDRARLLALLDTLLLAGAEPDAAGAGAVTPVLLLLGARAEPGSSCDEGVVLAALEQLIDEGVGLDAQDPRGFGPLHLACLHGLLQVARRLLRAGADPDLRDALNRSPREIAVMRGFVDVAAELAPATAQPGVSMARFLREPR